MLHDLCSGVEQAIKKRTQVRAIHQANAGSDEHAMAIQRKKRRAMHVQFTADVMVIGWINVKFGERNLGKVRHLVGKRRAHLVIVAVPYGPAVNHRERI